MASKTAPPGPMVIIKSDPPIPGEGTQVFTHCVQCQKRKRTDTGKGAAKSYAQAGEYERDPFCSSDCAKLWNGVPLPTVGKTAEAEAA